MALCAFSFLFLSFQGIKYTKFVMMTKFVGFFINPRLLLNKIIH